MACQLSFLIIGSYITLDLKFNLINDFNQLWNEHVLTIANDDFFYKYLRPETLGGYMKIHI